MFRRFCKLRNKRPFEKKWGEKGYTLEEIRKSWKGAIGLIIPKGFVVVDIDDKENAEKVLTAIGNDCAVYKSPHGAHLIYKLPPDLELKNWSKKSVLLGIEVDYRVHSGQIAYPTGQPGREIVRDFTGCEGELPEIFIPCKYKLPRDYMKLQEGERDTELTAHYGRLKRYDCDAEEIIHTLNSLLDNPLESSQVDKIINSINRKEKDKKITQKKWYTEDGKLIAYKLAENLALKGEIIYYNGLWHKYENGIWDLKADEEIGNYIRGYIDRPRLASIHEVYGQLKLLTVNNRPGLFNNDMDLIVFKNCAYKNGELLEFSKSHFCTMRVEADYNANAPTPENWLNFLNTSLANDTNIQALQEMLGYFLVINLAAKSFFVLYGPTDCGKSVISDLTSHIIGRDKVSNVSMQALCNTSDRWAGGELYNKKVNINTDISAKILKDTSLLKQFTGDTYLRYEIKNVQAFSGPVTCRLMFVANEMPPTTDHNKAFYNRLKIISFPESIPFEKQDKFLIDKLKMEVPGIVNWALVGLDRLVRNNYRLTEDIKAKEEYIEYSNNVLQFVKEHCTWNTEHIETSTDLYTWYKYFCKENGYIPFSQKNFIKELVNTGKCAQKRTSKARGIQGLEITYKPNVNLRG